MELNETITMPLIIEGTSHGPVKATVVYIHPKRRFYTVRFDFPLGNFRESFPMPAAQRNARKDKL